MASSRYDRGEPQEHVLELDSREEDRLEAGDESRSMQQEGEGRTDAPQHPFSKSGCQRG